jgi:hypothetical protein
MSVPNVFRDVNVLQFKPHALVRILRASCPVCVCAHRGETCACLCLLEPLGVLVCAPLPTQHCATPLSISVSRGDLAAVQVLLACGARVDQLASAIAHGRSSIATALVAHGASLSDAMLDAVKQGWAHVVTELVDSFGASVEGVSGSPSPLHLACGYVAPPVARSP